MYHALTFIEKYRRDQNVKINQVSNNMGKDYFDQVEENGLDGRAQKDKND
ncbi:MAG: hypothetical protein ACK5NI_00720 [bacterium]